MDEKQERISSLITCSLSQHTSSIWATTNCAMGNQFRALRNDKKCIESLELSNVISVVALLLLLLLLLLPSLLFLLLRLYVWTTHDAKKRELRQVHPMVHLTRFSSESMSDIPGLSFSRRAAKGKLCATNAAKTLFVFADVVRWVWQPLSTSTKYYDFFLKNRFRFHFQPAKEESAVFFSFS